MKTIITIVFLLIITSYLSAAVSPKDIYHRYRPMVSLVSFYQNIASDSKIGSFDKIKKYSIGILVSPDGLVMVSNEVYPVSLDIVSSSGSLLSGLPTDFQVKLSDGKEYPAEFLGKDDQAMMAFIQIKSDSFPPQFPHVQFSEAQHLEIADTVFILELLNQNYSFVPIFTPHSINAIVEFPRRKLLVNNYPPALSAGGLVLGMNGEAIGTVINQSYDYAFMSDGNYEDFQKKYLEIAPAEWFTELIKRPPNLKENQTTQKSWLGIQMQALTNSLREYWQVPQEGGVIINQIFPESPSAKAKLQIGDIILAVNDSALTITKDEETARLKNIILNLPPGTEIRLKIFRNKKIFTQKIELSAAPKAIGLAEKYQVPQLGFEIRELTRDILFQDNLPLKTPGVFVFQVDRASPAGIGGLKIGDIIQEINEEEVKDLPAAIEILTRYLEKSEDIYMLKILSQRTTGFVFMDLRK